VGVAGAQNAPKDPFEPIVIPRSTVRVNIWVASGEIPLVAVMVSGNRPGDDGIPVNVAVPLPLSVKVTPPGRAPVSWRLGRGNPVAVTVKLPGPAPVTKESAGGEVALVMAGGAVTVRVKLWLAGGVIPFAAVMAMGKTPEAVGVPDRVAVPLWLSTKLTPAGRAPVSVIAGVGTPLVVTVKLS
jgi:hypothetical protein